MKKYDSCDIKIFKGLEAVRKRPGMYIGNTEDGSGLHKMIFEVVDNSIDEFLEGECTLINVILHSTGYVTVIDNGRGMPVDEHVDEGVSAAEVIMTILHSGAKFDETSYKISSGLHGVGVSVVNALSSELILRIFRSGFIYEQTYSYGKPINSLSIIGTTDKRGTEISFLPDNTIFSFIDFNYQILFDRFMELSFLNPSIKIILTDERGKSRRESVFFETGGLKSYLTYLNKHEKTINKDIIYFSELKDNININLAFQWVEASKEKILCYTNNIFQRDGGSHLIALKISLTKVLKSYIEDIFLKKNDLIILGEDTRDGLIVVLSIYMHNPKFSSQIKEKLISLDARQVVEFVISNKFKDFLYENPAISKLICTKIITSAKARYAAKKAKDLVKKKSSIDFISLVGKLSDCQEKKGELSELFLVEGDSAGGSAKQARDRRTQAVLPLKGKILNVERSGFDKVLASAELRSILSALKCGVGAEVNNVNNLKYHKIIFMTDADVDGAHIKTLLLTFFYRHLPFLIENGNVYIANPPLYRVSNKNDFFYIRDKIEFNNFLFSKVFEQLNNLNIEVHDNFIFSYRDLTLVLDKLSKSCPKFFFEKLIYFNERIPNISNKNFITKIKMYEDFLNTNVCNKCIFINTDFLTDKFLKLIFINHGVKKEFRLDCIFFESEEYIKICNFNLILNSFFSTIKYVNFNNFSYDFYSFGDLISYVSDKVLSKYNIQRYKGLGEMNPKQLWDTTMNPDTRVLKIVKIKDAVLANDIFSSLMGENIESRKKFIYKNINSIFDLDF